MSTVDSRLAKTVGNLNRLLKPQSGDVNGTAPLGVPLTPQESLARTVLYTSLWGWRDQWQKHMSPEDKAALDEVFPSMADYGASSWNDYDSEKLYGVSEYCYELLMHVTFSVDWNVFDPDTVTFFYKNASSSINKHRNMFFVFCMGKGPGSREGLKRLHGSWMGHYTESKDRVERFERIVGVSQKDILLQEEMDYDRIRKRTEKLFNDAMLHEPVPQLTTLVSRISRKFSIMLPDVESFHPAVIEGALASDMKAILGKLDTPEQLTLLREHLEENLDQVQKLVKVSARAEDNKKLRGIAEVVDSLIIQSVEEFGVQELNTISYKMLEQLIDLALNSPYLERRIKLSIYWKMNKDVEKVLVKDRQVQRSISEANLHFNEGFSSWEGLPTIILDSLKEAAGSELQRWYFYEGDEMMFMHDVKAASVDEVVT